MAQAEDTELRDLVMEALERNGSLAKIRALVRANVYQAFEEEYDNTKYNMALDKILKTPEGVMSLSLVHEFLEFLNLKNTLFVYKSETRQGFEYKYEGQKMLSHKMNMCKQEPLGEPLLLTLLKNSSKTDIKQQYGHGDACAGDNHCRDEQNCTYIVHEDSCSSSSQSASQSDNSEDKNQLHLTLPLDNSDTDTSSDSMREKTSSEYIANEKIIIKDESEDDNKNDGLENSSSSDDQKDKPLKMKTTTDIGNDINQLKMDASMLFAPYHLSVLAANNSSDSTSYLDLQPYNPDSAKQLNTMGLPIVDADEIDNKDNNKASNGNDPKGDTISSATISNSNSINTVSLSNKDSTSQANVNKLATGSPEYTNDFSSSKNSCNKKDDELLSPSSMDISEKISDIESPHQISQSSQSSVSISDIAELLEVSESRSPRKPSYVEHKKSNGVHVESSDKDVPSNVSASLSESLVPSVSNLNLDYHSN